jgi:uncharacterized damage-inducible protein DinB
MRIDDTPPSWDERTTLTTMLDYARDTVRVKCEGLSEENARSAPLPGSPLMTISGLVSHLYWVERDWIERDFLGGEDVGPWTEEEPDREMSIALEIPLETLLQDYAAQAERYRQLVAGRDLDERAARPLRSGEHPTLRWILFHLVEETARRNGHIDILRELADGVTGS